MLSAASARHSAPFCCNTQCQGQVTPSNNDSTPVSLSSQLLPCHRRAARRALPGPAPAGPAGAVPPLPVLQSFRGRACAAARPARPRCAAACAHMTPCRR